MSNIESVMAWCRNYFADAENAREGWFFISDGLIDLPFVSVGQFFKIEGSTFNDGVYCYGVDVLIDEDFEGRIVPLKVPREFLDTCRKIGEFEAKRKTVGQYESESFGGYSYKLATGSDGAPMNGIDAYKHDLRRWKKL